MNILKFKIRIVCSFVLGITGFMLICVGCQNYPRWWNNAVLLFLGLFAITSGIGIIKYAFESQIKGESVLND